MGLLQRLFGKGPSESATGSQRFVSEPGTKRGASPVPFVIHGHHAKQTAQRIAMDTTMSCLAVWGLGELERVLEAEDVVGLLAMSRVEAPGEAGEAIRLYRRKARRPGAAFYGACDYNIVRAATRAVEYGADGIAMPGILTSEEYANIFGTLGEVQAGMAALTSVEEHAARLARFTTPKSPFWNQQDLVISKYY